MWSGAGGAEQHGDRVVHGTLRDRGATAYYANPVAVAYLFLMADAAVIALDLAAILVLGILLRYVKMTYAWVLVRILGVLLAALGVDLIITGLEELRIIGEVG